MKRTSYFNDLIVTYDNIFKPNLISMLEKDIQNVPFKWGTKDNPENPPTGLQCFSFEDTNVWQILWLETNKLDELQGYRYKRSNLNFFSTNEDAYYHDDDCDMTLLYYCNSKWEPNEKGETKFFITREDLKGYVLNDIEGDPDHLVVSIAPIPGRVCIFNSKVQHTATGFRSSPRFVPSLKFVNADQHGTDIIVDKNNNEPITVKKNFD